MHTSGRVRRTVALTAVAGLASALTWLPAGPAVALGPVLAYATQGTSGAASGCTVTSGSSGVFNGPIPLTNGKGSGSVNLITTWTNGSNSADITSVVGHYSGSTRVVKKNGAFRSGTLTGSGQISITRALGGASTCNVYAQVLNLLEAVTQQPAGWYYVTRSTTKSSLTETLVVKGVTVSTPVMFEVYQGGANTLTQRAFVPAGQYALVMAAGIEAGDYPALIGKVSNKNTMTAVFRDAGSAFSGTSGSGAKFVKFPGSISCSHHSAKLTWRSGASKVASGTFSVNGSKKASVSNPQAGHHVVLRHLSKTADNKITANLSLKGGGHASASRVYVPCKG